ncbi:MAG: 2Fe-2S iron-sulfur cluster binding protein [Noviherbaspirillum sp.]|nr:2Fe-2S iron-sulfur cluster binding protein [Noviherbaspirillum sp.]
MELVIEPVGRTIAIEAGANLLETLREYNVPVSYSCTAGRCGLCRCKVIEGHVLESAGAEKITNPNDDGHVLACMSVLTESCTVEIPEPDEVVTHPASILKATVIALDELTRDIRRLRLRAARPLSFTPGQYAMLQFTPEHARSYSMAGLPDDPELEFHVRLMPGGRVTGYIANQLKIGDTVRVTGPLGTVYLRRKHAGPMLCVAGGTGLAPVLSIVRGALLAGMDNPIHVYVGVRSPQDMYGAEWLERLTSVHRNLHVHVVVTAGNNDPHLRNGLVTDAVIQDWADLTDWRAYLCGAPPVVEAATILVKQKGILPEHVHAEAFYPSGI